MSDVCWTFGVDDVFLKVKTVLIVVPVLENPDFSKPFCVKTDASDVEIGLILTQGEEDEERVIVTFHYQMFRVVQLCTVHQLYNKF